jgi:hypothetical protein
MLIAFAKPELNTDDAMTAIVMELGGIAGIVCQKVGEDGEWEPLYVIMGDGSRSDLPICFVLADDAIEALNQLIWIIGD